MNVLRAAVAGVTCLAATSCTAAPPPSGPTELVERALTEDSGELLARAYQEHPPTADEIKVAAALLSTLAVSLENGALAPALMDRELLVEARRIGLRYPSFFTGEANPPPTGAIVDCSAPFDCDSDCVPSPALLLDTALALSELLLGRLVAASPLPPPVADVARAFQHGVSGGADARSAAQGLSSGDAFQATAAVASLISSGASFSAAGAELAAAAGSAQAAVYAASASSVAGVLAAAALGFTALGALDAAATCFNACYAHQVASCADGCTGECPRGTVCRSCGGMAECHGADTVCCGAGACDATSEVCVACPDGRSCLPSGSSEADCPDPCPFGTTHFLCAGVSSCVDRPTQCCGGVPVAGTTCPACESPCPDGTTCQRCGGTASCLPPGRGCCDTALGVMIECAGDERCTTCAGQSVCVRESDTCCRGGDSAEVCAAGLCATCAPYGSVCTPDGAANWQCCPGQNLLCPVGAVCRADGCYAE